MVRHGFHLEENISVIDADSFDSLLNYFLNPTPYYAVSIFRTEHYMVVDIIYTMTDFSLHRVIIPARPPPVNVFSKSLYRDIALRAMPLSSHPTRGVGFQGLISINEWERKKILAR